MNTHTTTTTLNVRHAAEIVIDAVEKIRQIKTAEAQPQPPGIVGAVHRAHLKLRLDEHIRTLAFWGVLIGLGDFPEGTSQDVFLETLAATAQNVLDGHPVVIA
ncbi:hypothetical protein KMZ30_07355 [Phycicoccus sp. KQZ13P-1]|uniref:hypothetical protein n=1 Tax=Phycicoccus mangrovi TaxID=2840470 RepID=UPI001C002F86|nr:hypothetical protein [Phycicoccus mangrovi]MBT9255388.1 hypothetical protein [Phycicoccus mangrovi]